MNLHAVIPFVLLLALCATPAAAASSDWHHADGGSLRIVTSSEPDSDGRLRGALEVRLKPGWKTYWADPGDSGVPPTVDVAGGGDVAIGFPAPKRFDDGYAVWAGYDHPIALALTFGPETMDRRTLEASVFLGMCETICIPVQARLQIDPHDRMADAEDEATVTNAFAALPAPARPGFTATAGAVDAGTLMVAVDVPDGVMVRDLFVAAGDTLALGAPRAVGPLEFSLPILRGTGRGEALHYTLVTSAGAVSGLLKIP